MSSNTLISKRTFAPLFSLVYKLFRYLLLMGVGYFAVFPILEMISGSLKTAEEMLNGNTVYIPNDPTFFNYVEGWGYINYWKHFLITVYYAGISTVIQVIICSLVGYGLGRYNFKGNSLVFLCVLFTIIMPLQTIQIPSYYQYRWFDFFGIGKLIGLITGTPLTVNVGQHYLNYFVAALFGVGLNSGIYIFLYRQFFAGMPRDLEEAAKIDGCGPFNIYLRIMVPNIIPVVVTVALLSMVYYWNDTLIASMSNLGTNSPLLMAIKDSMNVMVGTKEKTDMEIRVLHHALQVMSIMPLMGVFIICQKFFVECMDRSGSKG